MTNTDNVDHYGTSYDNFESKLYEEIRQETFGVDIGQDGWQTADEQDRFISWLDLQSDSELLNVVSGSGGPTLRIVQETGCSAMGIDIEQEAIIEARKQVQAAGVGSKVSFEQIDGNDPLEYSDGRFDGLICVDAVNHFENRPKIFSEWKRVLKPGGRLVLTDPIIVSGPISDEEMRIRSSIGYYLFVPEGYDEELLEETGFEVQAIEDRTEDMARAADRWRQSREAREADLRTIEGDETYEGQQTFFRITAQLAAERRLSRFAFSARATK